MKLLWATISLIVIFLVCLLSLSGYALYALYFSIPFSYWISLVSIFSTILISMSILIAVVALNTKAFIQNTITKLKEEISKIDFKKLLIKIIKDLFKKPGKKPKVSL